MTWNPKSPRVPVDRDGNWLSYPSYGGGEWEDVEPFHAELAIDSMRTGRSSKVVFLADVRTGRRYPMFVADMVGGIQRGDFVIRYRDHGGTLVATWTASKRGANYGIKAVSR